MLWTIGQIAVRLPALNNTIGGNVEFSLKSVVDSKFDAWIKESEKYFHTYLSEDVLAKMIYDHELPSKAAPLDLAEVSRAVHCMMIASMFQHWTYQFASRLEVWSPATAKAIQDQINAHLSKQFQSETLPDNVVSIVRSS